jgi:hypothetical protein
MARVSKLAREKNFLCTHSLLSKNFFIPLTDQGHYIVKNMCAYTHIPDCVDIVFELPLLPNYTASETFLGKSGWIGIVNWVFVTEAKSCR